MQGRHLRSMERVQKQMNGTPQSSMYKNESFQQIAPVDEQFEQEIDLLELFYRLLEKAKFIILVAVLGGMLFAAVTFFLITPKYTATSKLYVMNAGESAINLSDLQIGTYLAADYQEVFNNWHVHEMVIQALDLPYNYEEMADMLEITNPSDTRILYIAVTTENAVESKKIADAYAAAAQEFIASTMDTKMPNLFEEALVPYAPSSPSKLKNVLLGLVAGFVLACGIVVVQFLMDDKLHNGDEIEKYLGLASLGIMPKENTGGHSYTSYAGKKGSAKEG